MLKALQYHLRGSYRQWDSNWEQMLQDGMYMTDDEFLSNFRVDRSCVMQLNSLVEDDEAFRSVRLPTDWFDNNIVELGQKDELNQSVKHSASDTRRTQRL